MTHPFPGGRDEEPVRPASMREHVDTTVTFPTARPDALDTLLRHCFALERAGEAPRAPARLRLEQALGPALAHRLVSSLTAGSRR